MHYKFFQINIYLIWLLNLQFSKSNFCEFRKYKCIAKEIISIFVIYFLKDYYNCFFFVVFIWTSQYFILSQSIFSKNMYTNCIVMNKLFSARIFNIFSFLWNFSWQKKKFSSNLVSVCLAIFSGKCFVYQYLNFKNTKIQTFWLTYTIEKTLFINDVMNMALE